MYLWFMEKDKEIDNTEIRQYKLEKYRADYEHERLAYRLFYYLFIPVFVTFLIASDETWSKWISSIINDFFSCVYETMGGLGIICIGIVVFILSILIIRFIVKKIEYIFNEKEKNMLDEYKSNIDKLIKEVRKNEKK